MTDWAQIFTGLLFYAYVEIHQLWRLVFDNYIVSTAFNSEGGIHVMVKIMQNLQNSSKHCHNKCLTNNIFCHNISNNSEKLKRAYN